MTAPAAGPTTGPTAGAGAAGYTADIDVGGTFTDGFFTDGSAAHRAKVLTTPHDLTECFLGCLRRGAGAFGRDLPDFLSRTQVVRLSTTLGTNTLLQRRGPKVGLLVTSGAERSLYAGGDAGAHPLADPGLVRGIDEEVDAGGRPVRPPEPEQVLAAVRELVAAGARIIAVSLANSWRNPGHELAVRTIVRDRYPAHYLRSVPLQLAHEVTASDGDHIRANTVLLNAYLHGDLARGLYRAEDLARANGMRRPLLVVHAAGGSARVAKTIAVQTLSSGPAVAVHGAAVTARQLGLTHVVTADMGGTSFDVAILDGTEPAVLADPVIAGMRIAVPVIATESIGAGGGSIAQLVDGKLTVGPESAGSSPGPVCYGKGGQRPTVTDANLLLGLLSADGFLGGRMRLDPDRARTVLQRRLGRELGLDPETVAAQIRAQVNATMADEVRARLDASGADASAYTMFAFGGGGPLHACDIAERAGLRRVIGFPHGSVFSAFGSSTVDVWHRYARSADVALADESAVPQVAAAVDELARQGQLDMRGEGFAPGDVTVAVSVAIDRDGRREEIPLGEHLAPGGPDTAALAGADGVRDALDRAVAAVAAAAAASETSGAAGPGGARLREVLVDLRAPTPAWLPSPAPLRPGPVTPHAERDVRWSADGPAVRTPVVALEALTPGSQIDGPAIIDTADTVYAVNPGWTAVLTAEGNVAIERRAQP
jgi:N-methylhydantoinase A